MELREYIRSAKLADTPSKPLGDNLALSALENRSVDLDSLKAAVNAGSLLAFVDGLGVQAKEDVLYSTQFAQLAASAKFDRFLEVAGWYRAYVEWLETLGWVVPQFGFNEFRQDTGELQMDAAALTVVAATLTGGGTLTVLDKALDTLRGMADDSSQIKLFDFHTSVQFGGNFQMGEVRQADNGALALALGAFHFKSVDTRKKFLFFGWGQKKVNFWASGQTLTFNETLYSQVRSDVSAALGDRAQTRVASVGIL